jgi:hypothetical protein
MSHLVPLLEFNRDGLLMLGDRRLPFAVEFDQPWIKPQLHRAEANEFLEELEGPLSREAIEEPHEGDLVGKAKPVMRASAPAELYEIFLGKSGGPLELVAGKHCRCDTANAAVGKDASGSFDSVRQLVDAIMRYLAQHNLNTSILSVTSGGLKERRFWPRSHEARPYFRSLLSIASILKSLD